MTYKSYTGIVDFDEQARIFHGEVVGLHDVITFQGTSVEELDKAMAESRGSHSCGHHRVAH